MHFTFHFAGCHPSHIQGTSTTHSPIAGGVPTSGGYTSAAGKLDNTPRCMNPVLPQPSVMSNHMTGGSADPTQVRVMVPFNDKDRDIPAVQRAISIQQQQHINGKE